jgi:hypothetical protein
LLWLSCRDWSTFTLTVQGESALSLCLIALFTRLVRKARPADDERPLAFRWLG